ncbi:DUF924 domain-containing protein [Marivibrio halodurans]|uniref:DUF924 domain-containing protein n=1 Tax=Marivibrio halodurans TaxID=2039722 RepID=A0A8J7S775_9PROT|nr:DUF924 family protein [Marivibrio halodurans]MBP5856837.1 DUF924 domain-containing protein [Marivibrio halodurans]
MTQEKGAAPEAGGADATDDDLDRPVGADQEVLGVVGPDDDAQAVLEFWFGDLTPRQWFTRDEEVDHAISERFGTLAARVAMGGLPHWAASAGGLLAAVIVLDQFPRNLYRDDPRAYESDPQARALADEAIRIGADAEMGRYGRQFLYMPFMHSEELLDQERAVSLFEGLGIEEAYQSALRHREIIARFGRFPHRNVTLGRETTAEEAAFLEEPNSSF